MKERKRYAHVECFERTLRVVKHAEVVRRAKPFHLGITLMTERLLVAVSRTFLFFCSVLCFVPRQITVAEERVALNNSKDIALLNVTTTGQKSAIRY
jgi:hypothetical protein